MPPLLRRLVRLHPRRREQIVSALSEGFRRFAPTSLNLREQSITRCNHVALCSLSRPYESELSTGGPTNTNAALTCGTWDALHSAESEGFEPPEPFSSTVFKTAAIDHSANSPICHPSWKGLQRYLKNLSSKNYLPSAADSDSSVRVKNLYWKNIK